MAIDGGQAGVRPGERHLPVVPDTPRSWYVLALLTLSYALAYVDRQMLNLLVDPIKQSLAISDTQFSLIQGSAFVFSYMLMAPVFGRLVDITHRRNVLICGIAAWSLFTAACAEADTFAELFAMRCLVGMSEACVFPVAVSLIADYFSPRRSPRAMSIFLLGVQLGGGFSLYVSGLVIASAAGIALALPMLADRESWQIAFIVVGFPGLLFALLLLTVREPGRTHSADPEVQDRPLSFRESVGILWARRAFYGRMFLGVGSVGVVQLGLPAWLPAFLMRAHGMSPAETGAQLGIMTILVGTTAILAGPWAAGFLERRGYIDAHIRAAAFACVGMFVACLFIPVPQDQRIVLAVAGAVTFCNSFPVGLMAHTLSVATPSRLRGFAAALYTFSAQLIGYAIGPTVIALLTDRVFGDPRMVGHSLQIVTSIAAVIAALMFFTVMPHFRQLVIRQEAVKQN